MCLAGSRDFDKEHSFERTVLFLAQVALAVGNISPVIKPVEHKN